MKYTVALLVGMWLFAPSLTEARPVSYPGGWTLQLDTTPIARSLLAHYSPSKRYSIGYRLEYQRGTDNFVDPDYYIHALQLNALLKRWNRKKSQANLYLLSGVGLSFTDLTPVDELGAVVYTGLLANWETRRWYVSYQNRFLWANPIEADYIQTARLGVAPYIGKFGDLHTWLFISATHNPGKERNNSFAPSVLFLKDVHRIEWGSTLGGRLFAHWTIRF